MPIHPRRAGWGWGGGWAGPPAGANSWTLCRLPLPICHLLKRLTFVGGDCYGGKVSIYFCPLLSLLAYSDPLNFFPFSHILYHFVHPFPLAFYVAKLFYCVNFGLLNHSTFHFFTYKTYQIYYTHFHHFHHPHIFHHMLFYCLDIWSLIFITYPSLTCISDCSYNYSITQSLLYFHDAYHPFFFLLFTVGIQSLSSLVQFFSHHQSKVFI